MLPAPPLPGVVQSCWPFVPPRSIEPEALALADRALAAYVVPMDADLQNDPADLPALVAALAEADCVCGVRVERRDRCSARVASRLANGIRRRVLADPQDPDAFGTSYATYYVHNEVRYPRYLCYDCHRSLRLNLSL